MEEIFESKEDLNFKDEEIKLDRSWFNNVDIPEYVLKEEMQPELIIRFGNEVENCGHLKYVKIR